MLQIDSITFRGKGNRQVQLSRSNQGLLVRVPVIDQSVAIIKGSAGFNMAQEVIDKVLPLLYGEKIDGEYDCTDEEIRKLFYELEKLF